MSHKQCNKCKKVKLEAEFYANPRGGLRGKCKQCWSEHHKSTYVRKNRKAVNPIPWHIRFPEKRAIVVKEWNHNHRAQVSKSSMDRMVKYPIKHSARTAVQNAWKAGKLFKQKCKVCGNPKVEAHHEDYSKPLDVIWLCRSHHIQADKARVRKELGVTC